MKVVFKYTLVLLLVASNSYCQQAEMKSYNIVNDLGVTNVKYGVYPKDTYIYAGFYKNLSEVKNKTIEEVLKSDLSEQNIEWHHFNHDYRKKRDSIRDYKGLLQKWKDNAIKFELLGVLTYEYGGDKFAKVVYCVGFKKGAPFINTKSLRQDNGRWYITKSYPKFMLDLFIGLNNTKSGSVQNILSKQPANEGERILLEQSLNSNRQLDLVKLGEALLSIKEQAKTNTAIQSIVLDTGF